MKEAGHNSMLTLYNFSVLSFPTSHPQLKLNVLNSTPRDMVGVGGAIRAAQRAHDKHIHSPGEDYDQSEGPKPDFRQPQPRASVHAFVVRSQCMCERAGVSIHTPGEEQADYVVCPCIVILTLFDVQYNYVVDLTVKRGSDVSQDVMIQDEGPEVFCVRVCVGVCVCVCVRERVCVYERGT